MADPDPTREDDAEEASADAPVETSARAPEKKRKEKRAKARGAQDAPRSLPGAGTPEGDKLREAHRAFEVGDYSRVRARAQDLESASDPAVREAAAELAARVAIDPVQVVVILACAAVLATIVYVWVF